MSSRPPSVDVYAIQRPSALATLETAFFGREILNIVVGEGDERVERHERHDAWRSRLERSGFNSIELTHAREVVARVLLIAPPFSINMDDAFMVRSWRDLPVLAVSAWAVAK